MKSTLVAFVLMLAAVAASAEVVAAFSGDSVVLADGASSSVRALDPSSSRILWTTEGVANPRAIAVSGSGRIVVTDPIANRVAIIDNRSATRFAVDGGPEQPLFVGETAFVLNRDSSAISMFRKGDWVSAPSAAGASILRAARGLLIVYSPVTGEIVLHDPQSLSVMRRATVERYASDVEADDATLYLAIPTEHRIVSVDLATLTTRESFSIGAVPVDLELEGKINAISAGAIAIADPSSKRVWRVERTQSQTQAFFRAFVRSFAGLSLFKAGSSALPFAVDRVFSHGERRFAFDSASGTLYDVTKKEPRQLATGIDLRSVAFSRSGAAHLWTGSVLRRLNS